MHTSMEKNKVVNVQKRIGHVSFKIASFDKKVDHFSRIHVFSRLYHVDFKDSRDFDRCLQG